MGIDYTFEVAKKENESIETTDFFCRYGLVISFLKQIEEAKIKLPKEIYELFIPPKKKKFLESYYKGKWVEATWLLNPIKALDEIKILSKTVKENTKKLPKFKEYKIGVGTVEVSFYKQYKHMLDEMKTVCQSALKNKYDIKITIG